MADKKLLLNEDVTRKMMKLANIEPLASSFLDGMSTVNEGGAMHGADDPDPYGKRDDEEEKGAVDEGGMMYQRDDEPEEEMDDMPPMDDPEDMGDEDMGGERDEIESLVNAIADAIEQETGVPVSVDGGAGEEGGEEMPPEDPEADMDMPPAEDEPEEEVPLEEDEVAADLAAAGVTLEEANVEDDLVNEVTRRVARRLLRRSAGK